MRINNRTTRLVVVDEATSSLDPVAERDILTGFRSVRAGKTIVLVTHRFHHLAHEADRILYVRPPPPFPRLPFFPGGTSLLTRQTLPFVPLTLARCMKDGCIVESGTHAQLVRANGNYAALYHAQVEWTR